MRAYQASAVLWRHTWAEYETLGQVLGSPREWGLQGLENRGSVWSPGGRRWLWVVCKVISLKNTCCHLLVWNRLPCNYLGPEEHLWCAIPDLFSEWMFLVNCSALVGLVCYRRRFFYMSYIEQVVELQVYTLNIWNEDSHFHYFCQDLLSVFGFEETLRHAYVWALSKMMNNSNCYSKLHFSFPHKFSGGLHWLTNIITYEVEPQADSGWRQGEPWTSRQVKTDKHSCSHSHLGNLEWLIDLGPDVFGWWEEPGMPGGNPHKQGEDMWTPHTGIQWQTVSTAALWCHLQVIVSKSKLISSGKRKKKIIK